MKKLSNRALEDLAFLGDFAITADGKRIKGVMWDGDGASKTYLHATDCRNLARTLTEVAELLEANDK